MRDAPRLPKETTTRQAKSLITKKLKEQFPKTKFMLRANYAGCCDSYLRIEWLNDPQEGEVLAIIHPVSNGVRIHVERNELCDICGAETIACLRGKDNRGRANRWSACRPRLRNFWSMGGFKQSSEI